MTIPTFNPGPDWIRTEILKEAQLIEYGGERDEEVAMWRRKPSRPPLPTALHTVIRARLRNGATAVLTLHSASSTVVERVWEGEGWLYGEPAADADIESFEVLAEPRVLTARAFLDRLVALEASQALHRVLAAEFGVDA